MSLFPILNEASDIWLLSMLSEVLVKPCRDRDLMVTRGQNGVWAEGANAAPM